MILWSSKSCSCFFPWWSSFILQAFTPVLPNEDRNPECSCHFWFHWRQCLLVLFFLGEAPGYFRIFFFCSFYHKGNLEISAFRQKSFAKNLGGLNFCLEKSTCKGVNSGMIHTFSSPLSVKTKLHLQPHILNHILKEFVVEGSLYCFLVEILPWTN